jgi:hypothetical protein
MYGVIRQYKTSPGQIDAILRRSRDRFMPMLSKAWGFVSWTLMDAGPAGVITASVFEDELAADLAAGWYKENQAALALGPPQVTRGPIVIRLVGEQVQEGYGFLWRCAFGPADVEEAKKRLRDTFVPLIGSMSGFASYGAMDAGRSNVVSLSAFTNRESAAAAHQRTVAWTDKSLAGLVLHPAEIVLGEIKLRTAHPQAVTTHSEIEAGSQTKMAWDPYT